MILVEAGPNDARSFDAKIRFARQMAGAGYPAVVDEKTLPEQAHRPASYDSIAFLADLSEATISRIIVIGAEAISDESLMNLRALRLEKPVPVSAVGRFKSAQSQIGAQSKLAYALGFEPAMHDLSVIQPSPLLQTTVAPLFASGAVKSLRQDDAVKLLLIFAKDFLEDEATLPFLTVLGQQPGLDCKIVTAGVAKSQINLVRSPSTTVLGFSEISPATIAGQADIAVYFGPSIPGERMAAVALDVLQNSGLVIDCTEPGSLVASGAPVVRGPTDIKSLVPFLQGSILTNRVAMGQEACSHPWLKANSFSRLAELLELAPAKEAKIAKPGKSRTVYFPTNGVGLGHAQRCSLVADAMKNRKQAAFAAFPSCIPMLQARGFDCLPLVAKSEYHDQPFANDLLNYQRLSHLMRLGDTLVFDGGYVFDSVYRTVLEQEISAIWLRRGLWQPGQSSMTPLDREHIFDRVIVPDEALGELNTAYSIGAHVHRVGPIVQTQKATTASNQKIRSKLQTLFGQEFDNLVVTMLGGGEAADRSTQMQALCAQLSARPDCLHLMVVWPNAKVSPTLSGWPNSRVVKTKHALELCQASDLVVSAVGYNSFNEVLYHKIPTIFIPQMASYMDDQERRARAASDRDLAVTLRANELLMLHREVALFLDSGKAADIRKNLAAFEFPKVGTQAAAALIEQEVRR